MRNKNRRFLTVIKNMGIFLNDQNPRLSPVKKWSFLGLGPMCVATLKGVVREDINRKTFFVFFWALPESPNPPPGPNSGNLVLFFGRQKRRFARMTEIFFDDDNDGFNDNYDDNFGNFDDNYDKND